MKRYSTPEIKAVDTLAFETVCAKSGASVCAYGGFSEVDPYNNTCQICFQENMSGIYGTEAVPSAQAGMAVVHYLQNKGNCPEGFSL